MASVVAQPSSWEDKVAENCFILIVHITVDTERANEVLPASGERCARLPMVLFAVEVLVELGRHVSEEKPEQLYLDVVNRQFLLRLWLLFFFDFWLAFSFFFRVR